MPIERRVEKNFSELLVPTVFWFLSSEYVVRFV